MGRQRTPVQINQFVGGINTEANPLSFPTNSSSDEQNMGFNNDGSRSRRKGFDYESGHSFIDTTIAVRAGEKAARGQFLWDNPGGLTGRQFLVVQIGNYIGVHDLDNGIISSEVLYQKVFNVANYTTTFGFASVDGTLVVASGSADLFTLDYDGVTWTANNARLLIRDLFGVEDTTNGVKLTDRQNYSIRPTSLTDRHVYNLRNQTWGPPHMDGGGDVINARDPIQHFFEINTYGKYPSNSDSVIPHLVPNSNYASNRTAERFNPTDAQTAPPGNSKSPTGHFIIDAIERGASREAVYAALRAENPALHYPITGLNIDIGSAGPTVMAQYAGRAWYAGFPGSVNGGDNRSPSLDSYVLFSQIVRDPSQLVQCFQEADPTSNIDPDLVDTDGGMIKVSGVSGISRMVEIGASLFIFSSNGIWRISGGDNNSFTATTFSVSKLTDEGCISGNSVVVQGGNLFYWGKSDIFIITYDPKAQSWGVESITEQTIKTLYQDISTLDKNTVVGYYEEGEDSLRWIYGVDLDDDNKAEELVLNLKFKAFTKYKVPLVAGVKGPISVSGGQPLLLDTSDTITVNGVVVTSDSENVYTGNPSIIRDSSESNYCIVDDVSTTITYSFGGYVDGTISDWSSQGTALWSDAFIETGVNTGGDARLNKDVPYLTTYFKEGTENLAHGYETSCLLQSQWNWTTDVSAGKWSNKRQAYRPSRIGTGHTITANRNKIRGSGRSVAFRFEAEDEKDFHIYGWDFNLTATTEE